MFRKLLLVAFALLALTAFIAGCSDDSSTTGPTGHTGSRHFTDFGQIIAEIAPPVYNAPTTAPGTPDSIWTEGQYALLGKVFGEEESMSLYANINALDSAIADLEEAYAIWDTMSQSSDTTINVTQQYTISTESLTVATTIPLVARTAFGFDQVMLQRVFKGKYIENGDTMQYHIGYNQADSGEIYVTWFDGQWPTQGWHESNLYYAYLDLSDSSIVVHGVFYKETTDETATWAYEIKTIDPRDFAYRMAWFSNTWGDTTGVGSVIGGGNRDTLFAMKYREFSPADSQEPDSTYALEQMFDSAYTYLGSPISAGLEEHVMVDSMFGYDEQPTDFIPSPWAD